MEHALTLSHVTKRFGDFTAVDDLSLAIPKGSIYGFIGPNGAGKTTTLRILYTVLQPVGGRAETAGFHHRGEGQQPLHPSTPLRRPAPPPGPAPNSSSSSCSARRSPAALRSGDARRCAGAVSSARY